MLPRLLNRQFSFANVTQAHNRANRQLILLLQQLI
jgi:hypothetical protein